MSPGQVEEVIELGQNPRKWAEKPYTYGALLPDEIRVLILYPGKAGDPLHGTLETLCLDRSAEYKAISYAWGEPVFIEHLHLDQGILRITPSLCGALRRFRSEKDPVRLWADGVCIRQQHDASEGYQEKNHQVKMMDAIFVQAEEVLIWLGEAQPLDDRALWTLNFLYTFATEHSDGHQAMDFDFRKVGELPEAFEQHKTTENGCLQLLDRSDIPSWESWSLQDALSALVTVWERPWFGRLWYGDSKLRLLHVFGRLADDFVNTFRVLQEAYFAKSLSIFFGTQVTSKVAMRMAIWVHYNYLFWNHAVTNCASSERKAVYRASKMWNNITSSHQLHVTLFDNYLLSTSEPRDRVFAIRAMSGIEDIEELAPDYSISLTDLWTRTTMFILTDDPIPDTICPSVILAIAATQGGTPNAIHPSWVPDLSKNTAESARKYSFYEQDFASGEWRSYAGGHQSFEVNLEEAEEGILWLNGVLVCEVDRIRQGSQYRPSSYTMAWPATVGEYWQEVKTTLIPWYIVCHDFASQVLESDFEEDEFDALLHHGRPFGKSQEPVFEEFRKCFGGVEPHSFTETTFDVQKVYEDLGAFLSHDLDNVDIDSTRVLASTTGGQLGWIPETSQPGDVIYLFKGAPFPFVLRPREDGYFTLIGDAYIDGIMDGEAWPVDEKYVELIGLK